MRYIALAASALVAFTFPIHAVEGDGFHWRGKLAAGHSIEIKGVNGEIRAEGTSGTEVEVIAHKIARRSDPSLVEVQMAEHGGDVTVCAVYPTRMSQNECLPGNGHMNSVSNNDVRVDFEVRVPVGVRFIGRTVNGGITGTALRADAEAYTVNGRIRLFTTGAAQAKSVNGSITAGLGNTLWPNIREFSTVNGTIELSLPRSTSADIRASTVNGGISTDFPLTASGSFLGRRISATLGNGGRQLKLTTVNGSIRLRQNPSHT